MTRYTFRALTEDEAGRWDDLIAPFEQRELFHSSVWLQYLASSRKLKIRRWAIEERGAIVGYFCGGEFRKGPFKLFGSPLRSWGTNFLGPIVGPQVDQSSLLDALDDLAHREGYTMAEIESRVIDESNYEPHGYRGETSHTFVVHLEGTEDAAWKNLESTCRNRVRRGIKAGLVIEDTDDPAIADEFYDRYTALMRRKGLVPPFPREYAQAMCRQMRAAGRLFALRVKDPAGEVLAVGLYPHDDRSMYFWGGSSYQEGRDLCPNEFMHWNAIQLALKHGIKTYNMCGNGQFKSKFGGELVTLCRWHKCYSRTAKWARDGYAAYFKRSLQVAGWFKQHSRALPKGA